MAGNQQGLNLGGSLNTSLGQGQLGLQNQRGLLGQQPPPPNVPTGLQGFTFPTTANASQTPGSTLGSTQINPGVGGQTNKQGIGAGLGSLGSSMGASNLGTGIQSGVQGTSGLNMGSLKLPGTAGAVSSQQPSTGIAGLGGQIGIGQSRSLPPTGGIGVGTGASSMTGSLGVPPGYTAQSQQGGTIVGTRGIGQTTSATISKTASTGLSIGGLGQTSNISIAPGGTGITSIHSMTNQQQLTTGTTGLTQTTSGATLGSMPGLKMGQGPSLGAGIAPNTITGTGNITQSTTGIASGMGIGATKPSVITGGSGNATATPTTTSRVTGLGGTSVNQGPKKTQIVSVSENPVPDELAMLVEHFKSFMEQQKSTGEEISKVSESFDKQFKSIQNSIDHENQQAVVIERQTTQLSRSISQLKEETNKEARIVEVAQRTRELPAGLQHENTAPDEFFHEVTIEFEKRMHMYRNQLEELESYLGTFLSSSSSYNNNFGPSEIVSALQSQHQPFLVLAARLQVVHGEVQRLKDQYLSLRKLVGHSSPDVFSKQKQQQQQKKQGSSSTSSVEPLTGPSPFAASIAQATAALTAMATAGHLNQGLGSGSGLINSGLGLKTGTGMGHNTGLGMGMGHNTGLGMGMGHNTGLGMGLGNNSGLRTSLGTTGGLGTGLGTTGGLGIGLGTTGGLGTGLGTGQGIGLGGSGLGGTSTGGNLGVGMGLGINSGMNTAGLTVAGGTKPFQLKAPPLGKKVNQ